MLISVKQLISSTDDDHDDLLQVSRTAGGL